MDHLHKAERLFILNIYRHYSYRKAYGDEPDIIYLLKEDDERAKGKKHATPAHLERDLNQILETLEKGERYDDKIIKDAEMLENLLKFGRAEKAEIFAKVATRSGIDFRKKENND